MTSASHIDFNFSVSQGLLPLTLGTFLQYYFAILEPYRFSGPDGVNNTFISMSFFSSPLLILYNLSFIRFNLLVKIFIIIYIQINHHISTLSV